MRGSVPAHAHAGPSSTEQIRIPSSAIQRGPAAPSVASQHAPEAPARPAPALPQTQMARSAQSANMPASHTASPAQPRATVPAPSPAARSDGSGPSSDGRPAAGPRSAAEAP
jgi:hypothetical protein